MEGSRGRKSAQKCPEFLLHLEIFRVGVAQFIVNIFSPVRKVEKNWCPFTSGIPSRIEPCRVLCANLAGGDNFKGVKYILDLVDLRLLAGFSMGGLDAPPP